MIARTIEKEFIDSLHRQKTIVLYGPRQAGKTTLVKKIYDSYQGPKQYLLADFLGEIERIKTRDRSIYTQYMDGLELLIIDEAQRIDNIGLILKALHDSFPRCQIIATGSSSFELAQHIQEPLTGRKIVFSLMPCGLSELYASQKFLFQEQLPELLLYGMYPAVYTTSALTGKRAIIREIAQSYIFKDILMVEGIKRSDVIVKLCKLLAYQIGKPVVLSELANKLQISAPTVDRYLTILEQAFVVFRLGSYSKNLRKELAKGQKYYFRDVGIRNAIIESYTPLEERPDKGEVRENFVIAEIMKQHAHTRQYGNYYFWRTYDGQEIDLLYELDGDLSGYEIKYKSQVVSAPVAFADSYPNASFSCLHRHNLLDHLVMS